MLPVAKAAFLLLAFFLPFTKHGVTVGRLQATATDFLYLLVVAALAIAFVMGQAQLRLPRGFAIVAAYLAAMIGSVLVAESLGDATTKLASQLYLLSLPFLTFVLIEDCDDLRDILRAWLAGTAVSTAIGAVTVVYSLLGSTARRSIMRCTTSAPCPPAPTLA